MVFTCPDLNFNLVRYRELHGYQHISIQNVSSISAEWSIRESLECLQVPLKESRSLENPFFVYAKL